MILIIGGAYQGKCQYAREHFGLSDADIFTCSDGNLDLSKRCINALEEYILACTKENVDYLTWFREHRPELTDKILICQDIFCGVVPMDTTLRQWRQDTGRLCQYLSSQADQVIRVFCGLGQRIK